MRIGVAPFLDTESGGTYQYSVTMLRTLYDWKCGGSRDEFVIFAHDLGHPVLADFPPRRGWTHVPIFGEPPPRSQYVLDFLRRVVGAGLARGVRRWFRRKIRRQPTALEMEPLPAAPAEDSTAEGDDQPAEVPLPPPDLDEVRRDLRWESWLKHWRVEFVIHHGHGAMPFEVNVPYVLAVHDLQHRLQPEFPEVSADGEWEAREYFFRNACRHATLLLVDSPVGKEDVLNCYGPFGVEPDRVQILPFLPACYLRSSVPEGERRRVRETYHLPERYLFYPAQFWPHKNHARLVQALGLLKQQGHVVPLVCCGGVPDVVCQQALEEMQDLAWDVGVQGQIHILGYVPDGHMSGLFAGATALAFPTFFGPTNIPPLEAWSLGCPVLTSDIRGIREQVGDAALLVDPRSAAALAAAIGRLWTDDALREDLIARGKARLATYTPDDYGRRLADILEEAKRRVRSGRAPPQGHPFTPTP